MKETNIVIPLTYKPRFLDRCASSIFVGLGFDTKHFDSIEWEEVETLDIGPIVGYAEPRDLVKPVKFTELKFRYWLDGSKIKEEADYDIMSAFDSAIIELLYQLPAKHGRWLSNSESLIPYFNEFIGDGKDYLQMFSLDDGWIIGGVITKNLTRQMIIMLPIELAG
jgi:hypothetical protein